MTADLDTRRRRALYRATHRGTKELDWLVGHYAEAHLESMDAAQLGRFEELLALPEPRLQAWLLAPAQAADIGEHSELVAAIRLYHNVTGSKADR